MSSMTAFAQAPVVELPRWKAHLILAGAAACTLVLAVAGT